MPRLPRSLVPVLRLASRRAPSVSVSVSSLASTSSTPTPTTTTTTTLFRTRSSPTRSFLSAGRPSLVPRAPCPSSSSPILSLLSQTSFGPAPPQKRFAVYGAEYQPSQVRRKRKHGFLVRKRSKNGRKTLQRRWNKGRKFLSH